MSLNDAAHIYYRLRQNLEQGIPDGKVYLCSREKTMADIDSYIRKSKSLSGAQDLLRHFDPDHPSRQVTWDGPTTRDPEPSTSYALLDPPSVQMDELVLSYERPDSNARGADSEVPEYLAPSEMLSFNVPNTSAPHTPLTLEAQRTHEGVDGIMSQALLIASSLTKARRNWTVSSLVSEPSSDIMQPDPDLLWQSVDMLAWLQVSLNVILLALEYFSHTSWWTLTTVRHDMWARVIISLKLAHTFLEDHPFSIHFWSLVLQKRGVSAVDGFRMERDVLAHTEFSALPAHADWELVSYQALGAARAHLQNIDTAMQASNDNHLIPPGLPPSSRQDSAGLWEVHKGEICVLYRDEKRPLRQVMDIMKQRGFVASERAYRQKLSQWSVYKNGPSFPGTGVIRDGAG